MPQPSVRQADLFSRVGTLLSTSFNRGMQLEAIAALLGHIKHRKMEMTLIYARIANRVIADEYAADGRSRFHCAALSLDARRRASPAAYRAAGKERHHKHWGRGPVPFGFHGAWIPQAPPLAGEPSSPHDHWRRATSGPARGLRQALSQLCRGSAFGGRAQGRSAGAAAGAAGGRLTGLGRAPRHDAAGPGRMGDLHPAGLGLG